MKDKLLNVFTFGNAQRPGVYFDEENRRHLLTIREAYINLAVRLSHSGRNKDARMILEKCDQGMNNDNMPYGMGSRFGNDHNQTSAKMAYAAYAAGDLELGRKIAAAVRHDCQQQIAHYMNLPDRWKIPGSELEYESQTAGQIIQQLDQMPHP